MHRLPALAAALTALALTAAPAAAADRVAVAFTPAADAGERRAARAGVDATIVDTLVARVQILEVPEGAASAAVADLEERGDVAWAERGVRRTRTADAPDDPLFASQWALRNTGQYSGVPGADVDVLTAWDASLGAGALVGVVDSGVAADHPDTGDLHVNAGETPGNGIDDDLNGFADDVAGWDFANGDADPADDQGHGTAVGSVIHAATGNAIGMAGVAPQATVVHAKALAADGSGSSLDVARAMDYVAEQGATIVNLSLGGPESSAEAAVIAAHPDTLFVVSAGNSNEDNDVVPSYPCADEAANVLCVGASTSADAKASFSSYGHTTVDVMAPGQSIHGAVHTGGYATWSGTSFSAPVTAGIAALLEAYRPALTAAGLKAAILDSAEPVAAFAPITVTGGRVNAARALADAAGPDGTTVPPAEKPADTDSEPDPQPAPEPSDEPEPQPESAPAPVPPGDGAPAPDAHAGETDPPPALERPEAAAPTVRLAPGARRRGRAVRLRLTTSGAAGRKVVVRLRRRGRHLGAGSVRARDGRRQALRVALTRSGRRALAGRRTVRLQVEVRLAGRVLRATLRVAPSRRR